MRRARGSLRQVAVWLACAAACLVGAGGARAQDISPYVDATVVRVDVAFANGQAQDDDAELRQVVDRHVRVGEPLSADAVHDAILELVENGLASRVTVETASGGSPSTVAVTFRVRRQVRLAAIDFDNVAPEIRDEIRARLTRLESGQPVSQAALEQSADEVTRYFQERGFFEVRVRATLELDETGTRATANFDVERGEQARVSAFTIAYDGERVPDLEGKLTLQPGDPYTQTDLESDMLTIRNEYLAAGFLSPRVGSPEVIRNPAANTVAIQVAVSSGPRVEVVVEGADLSEKKLKETLPIYTEGGLDDFQLAEGDRRLLNELQLDGYFFARVSHRVDETPAGGRRVVYTVDRGRRFKVTDIEIEGTSAISYADVAEGLQSKVSQFFILSRGLTSRELLERDSSYIERRLRAIGYRSAQVVERRLGISPTDDDLVITFVVEEGPRTVISDVAMRGNTVFSREELLESPAVEAGEFYSDADIAADGSAILRRYAGDGYVSAEVSTELVELDGNRARLVFDIVEGRRARIASIRIAGNLRTKEESIRRYLRFSEGQILDAEKLRLSEQALYNTSAFRQVIIRSQSEGVSDEGLLEERVVYVDVEETKPWLLVYGGGFNTDDGPRGIFEISNVNLFGRLNTGALRMRASARQQLGEIYYTNPFPLGYDLPALLAIRADREERESFTSFEFGALAQVQKKLDDRTGFFFRYSFKRIIVSNLQLNENALEREDRPVRLGILGATYYRDRLSNPFDPDDGDYMSFDFQVAVRALGSSDSYTRFFGEYKRFDRLPKFDEIVYAFATKLGAADPYGQSVRLPISQRFFSGGATTLRGFKFEQAGPRDPLTNEPRGGNLLVVVNNELRFPIFWRIGGTVFNDVGNVFRRVRDFSFNDLTVTVGAGLRLDTPVGPVRIDYGVLTNPPPGVSGSAVHVSFGQAF